jgi:hypothetical protein
VLRLKIRHAVLVARIAPKEPADLPQIESLQPKIPITVAAWVVLNAQPPHQPTEAADLTRQTEDRATEVVCWIRIEDEAGAVTTVSSRIEVKPTEVQDQLLAELTITAVFSQTEVKPTVVPADLQSPVSKIEDQGRIRVDPTITVLSLPTETKQIVEVELTRAEEMVSHPEADR